MTSLDSVLGGRLPTLEDLPRLKYIDMIAKESMRLYPPAYGLGREAIEECEIGGFRVPRKDASFHVSVGDAARPAIFP